MTVELEQFFQTIWGDSEGTVCLSFKDSKGKFHDEFFAWPGTDTETLCEMVRRRDGVDDCYFVPSILRGESRKKLSFKSSGVVWVDADNGIDRLPLVPSYVVETSPGRFHAYWKLDQVCSSQNQLEETNKELAKLSGADMSGWDCTQLLRIPGTTSKKHGAAVVKISGSEISYSLEAFPKALAPPLFQPLLTQSGRCSGFQMILN